MKKMIKTIYFFIIKRTPVLKVIFYTRSTQTPVTLKILFFQKILGFNRSAYWPMHYTSTVKYPNNIYVGIDVSPGYMQGCYIQGMGKIYLGDYTQVGPNVGIITANHDFQDNRQDILKAVEIGSYCWLGMGAMIMPGVKLGDFTIVGAGSVVTKSFSEGYCIIAGSPAKLIRKLNPNECHRYENEFKYNGYLKHDRFQKFRKNKLFI